MALCLPVVLVDRASGILGDWATLPSAAASITNSDGRTLAVQARRLDRGPAAYQRIDLDTGQSIPGKPESTSRDALRRHRWQMVKGDAKADAKAERAGWSPACTQAGASSGSSRAVGGDRLIGRRGGGNK